MVTELAALVERDDDAAIDAVESAVKRYASFVWEHMGREEGVILPTAQRHLKPEDWTEIDAAFSENRDPRFGGETDLQYRQLFSRIVNLATASGSTSA